MPHALNMFTGVTKWRQMVVISVRVPEQMLSRPIKPVPYMIEPEMASRAFNGVQATTRWRSPTGKTT